MGLKLKNALFRMIFKNKLRVFLVNFFISFCLTVFLMWLILNPDGTFVEGKPILGWIMMPGFFCGALFSFGPIHLSFNLVSMCVGQFVFIFLMITLLMQFAKCIFMSLPIDTK